MDVLKMGSGHRAAGINCQDAIGRYKDIVKIVCDGCSEGIHSEIGSTLFCKKFIEKYQMFFEMGKDIDVKSLIYVVMDELVESFGNTLNDIKNYLSFTTIIFEHKPNSDVSHVYYCGDGYIIEEKDGDIIFYKLDCGEYPMYLAYNYVPGEALKHYKDGCSIGIYEIDAHSRVGVASDGIRFIADRDDADTLKTEFKNILKSGKEIKMKLFFNRNDNIFLDDFSIVY